MRSLDEGKIAPLSEAEEPCTPSNNYAHFPSSSDLINLARTQRDVFLIEVSSQAVSRSGFLLVKDQKTSAL
ncbi:hypothetical protein KSB_47690 [Ktedonobacter robiniae]|uniref:Uncharacterized protein n=1 Tax=Ktedonobacter robiniae TaxID=2778365 RepID=A0ABQ3UTX5_9CHLR|nr:hypothetical protein KSB_47690 [Ktedonobacter robiniae]